MKYLFLIFLVFSGLQVQAQLSPVSQDTFPWFVNYRLPTRVVGTKAPSSIFVMDSTQTKLRAVPTDSIIDYIGTAGVVGYREFVGVIAQSSTTVPTVTVLFNSFDTIPTFTRSGVGAYAVDVSALADSIPTNKTYFNISNNTVTTGAGVLAVGLTGVTASSGELLTITFETRDDTVLADGILANAAFGHFVFRLYNE